MSKSIITITMDALKAAGLRTFEAYPGTTAPVLTGSAVAVSLDGADVSEKTVKVRLLVMVPISLGGSGCRTAAVKALGVLQKLGASASLEGSEYNRKSSLITMAVTGIFRGTEQDTGFEAYVEPVAPPPAPEPEPEPEPEPLTFSVMVGSQTVQHPVSFSAWSSVKSAAAVWYFKLEELIPLDSQEESEPAEPFQIRVVRDGGTETYNTCIVTDVERVVTEKGLKKIRQGMAPERI